MSKSNIRSIALNYGLVMGGASVLLNVIQYATGEYSLGRGGGNWVYGLVATIVGIAIVVFGINNLKKSQGGYASFGEAFKLTFSMYIYAALVGVVWLALYMFVLEPNYLDIAMVQMEEQMMEQNPNMSEDQLEMALNMSAKFMSPWMMIIFAVLASALMGAIFGAIMAAIMQKKKPEYLDQQVETEDQ